MFTNDGYVLDAPSSEPPKAEKPVRREKDLMDLVDRLWKRIHRVEEALMDIEEMLDKKGLL